MKRRRDLLSARIDRLELRLKCLPPVPRPPLTAEQKRQLLLSDPLAWLRQGANQQQLQ